MRWYSSKVDRWLAAVLVGAAVVSIGTAVAAIASNEGATWIALASPVFLLAIYGGLVFPMRYAIADDELVVRHGLVRRRIPLREISRVEPTSNPLSSPALSLDRLRITYGTGSVMISPADKAGFLGELAAKAGLHADGDALVR